MARILTKLRIDEVSAVDKGAGDGVKIVLMKRDDTPRSKPHVERHARRLRKFEDIFMRKQRDDGAAYPRNRSDVIDDDRNDGGGAGDHHASKVADLLVEAGSHPDRASALSHLLHSPQGQALLARMHKKDDPPMTSTSHTEFVQSVVKQYGIVALAKSMVQDQKSYGLDEPTFTRLATEHAQRIYLNDRPDVAFSKLYQSEESVRRACAVCKAMPFVADLTPLVVGGEDTRDLSDPSKAIEQLKQLGRDKWPTASEAQQFANAFTDPVNRELASKAHVRPVAPAGGIYPYPR
jgi:hypothetical protein